MNRRTEDALYFITWLIVSCVFISLTIFIIVATFAMAAKAAPPDEVAVDFALATMVEGVGPKPNPTPFDCSTCKDTGWIMHGDGHQTKCPNCDLAGLPGGPLDIIRQAKELIRKGNELVERGKALLDAFEKDGKITIDVKLPQTVESAAVVKLNPVASDDCSNGQCNVTFSQPRKQTYKKKQSSWRWQR